ncbi:hypothetical protein ES703_97266 [subsurface metagenome]
MGDCKVRGAEVRRFGFFVLLVLNASLFITCYWSPDQETGALSIDISAIARAKSELFVRVYLRSDKKPPNWGTDYLEAIIKDSYTDVTFQDISPGRYMVYLELGERYRGEEYINYRGESEGFIKIVPGELTEVTILVYSY